MSSTVTVSAADQIELIRGVFSALGATPEESEIQADMLTEADLRGVHSHGIQRLPVLVERIRRGLLRVAVDPERTWTAPAVMSVDGLDGIGPAIAESSLREASPVARRLGAAVVAIRNTSHLGMLGYYCRRRAEEGLICIGFTTSEVLVHPHGGAERLVGTNPIAIGIPTDTRPFVFDMATSIVPMGRIIDYKHRGLRLPDGWAIDAEGNPTNDPAAALEGALAPVAGPKGFGLGVAIALLAGLLPGAAIGRAVKGTLDVEHRCNKGDLFILLDPAAFAGGASLTSAAQAYLDELRGSRPQAGFDRVMVAGDRGDELRSHRLQAGIPHPSEVWHAAEQLRSTVPA